ncbi:MAG: DUF2786 domain-containing protein, partial [Actinomycetia bacterium]|nr:DUF2786 domain-containing protein [Actinomycetes bacterium]
MGIKNRERRAAKKRARGRAKGPTSPPGGSPFDPGSPFDNGGGPFGSGGLSGGSLFGEAPGPPPLTAEVVADCVAAAACSYAHGDGEALTACVSRLRAASAQPGRVDRGIELAMRRAVEALWAHGWLPLDLVEHARRTVTARSQDLLTDIVAAQVSQYGSTSLHPRWRESLERAGTAARRCTGGPAVTSWAERHGLARADTVTEAIGLLAVLHRMPALPPIVAPPGSREATRAAAQLDGRSSVGPKVLARVRGLLAKAESTAFSDEAEALSAKAQQLMNRHALAQAVVDADESPAQTATAVRLWLDSPYVRAKSLLVSAVADANRCKAISYEDLGFVTVVGHDTDLEVVELLVTSLLVQANRAMLTEGRATTAGGRARSKSFRQSFLIAYAARIGERLREAAYAASHEIDDPRLLPVLAD